MVRPRVVASMLVGRRFAGPALQCRAMTEPSRNTGQPQATRDTPDAAEIARQVEAVLLTVDRPITAGRIAETLELDASKPVTDAIDQLNAFYQTHDRSFRIEQVANGYQVLTLPRFGPVLSRLHKTRQSNKLSPAQIETLTIVAYRQPILRADIEAIRGAASGEVLRALMDRNLIKITGRADEPGRPMLYGTTRQFLEVFGLSSLKDLPKAEELGKS